MITVRYTLCLESIEMLSRSKLGQDSLDDHRHLCKVAVENQKKHLSLISETQRPSTEKEPKPKQRLHGYRGCELCALHCLGNPSRCASCVPMLFLAPRCIQGCVVCVEAAMAIGKDAQIKMRPLAVERTRLSRTRIRHIARHRRRVRKNVITIHRDERRVSRSVLGHDSLNGTNSFRNNLPPAARTPTYHRVQSRSVLGQDRLNHCGWCAILTYRHGKQTP